MTDGNIATYLKNAEGNLRAANAETGKVNEVQTNLALTALSEAIETLIKAVKILNGQNPI
jgi:hypothetical protein